MRVRTIRTPTVTTGSHSLLQLLDETLSQLKPKSVLAITSKIVALCEGSTASLDTPIDELVRAHAEYYIPTAASKYGISFAVTRNILIPNAGIDESNANNCYVLWPRDPQETANHVRAYLVERFHTTEVGIIITDSTCRPLRRGVSGIAIAHSGFHALRDYVGTPDLFGRPFKVAQSDIAGGLASTAVLVMGEGTESTPLAVIEDPPSVIFVNRNPSTKELADLRIPLEDDLFAPFLLKAVWRRGNRNA